MERKTTALWAAAVAAWAVAVAAILWLEPRLDTTESLAVCVVAGAFLAFSSAIWAAQATLRGPASE